MSATATRTILALDLGKYKSMAFRYEPDTGEVQFRALDTGRVEFLQLCSTAVGGIRTLP